MKAAFLAYHSVFDDEIRELLEQSECRHYFEIPKAWASDGSEKRFDSRYHPGTDSLILAFVTPEQAERLVSSVRTFRAESDKEHTHLALFSVEEFI